MTAIKGNTYPVKDALKALGARWNPAAKAWMISDELAPRAWAIVGGAPRPAASPKASARPHYNTCHDCGGASYGAYICAECQMYGHSGGSDDGYDMGAY
ncbi:MAG: hypothetical protein ACRECN_00390 [Methylocella sp.]